MGKFYFSFVFLIVFSLSLLPALVVHTSAQEDSFIPPRKQWKETSDINQVTCKEGLVLIQKSSGAPACVSASAYLKLIDRGYGMFDPEIMMERPMMSNNLIEKMTSNQMIMNHWHEMMINDKSMIQKTMQDWISKMKEDPKFLENMMGPMTSDPDLRNQMIEQMRQHGTMMNAMQAHPQWMESVHEPMMKPGMGHNQGQGMHIGNCPWCPEYEMHAMHEANGHSMEFSHSGRMMDMMHHMWINPNMTKDMHDYMIENPSHMAQMSKQMIGPMLGFMMDDPELRQQMIELMLEHKEFMDSIRHENPPTN